MGIVAFDPSIYLYSLQYVTSHQLHQHTTAAALYRNHVNHSLQRTALRPCSALTNSRKVGQSRQSPTDASTHKPQQRPCNSRTSSSRSAPTTNNVAAVATVFIRWMLCVLCIHSLDVVCSVYGYLVCYLFFILPRGTHKVR